MNKKGFEIQTIGWWILALGVLAIAIGWMIIQNDSFLGAIQEIGDRLRFG